ncbi:hypothetical protein D3C87_1310120 [compost metagenome]
MVVYFCVDGFVQKVFYRHFVIDLQYRYVAFVHQQTGRVPFERVHVKYFHEIPSQNTEVKYLTQHSYIES